MAIDVKKQVVTTREGTSFSYDHLIIATGTVTDYFGITGLAEFSHNIQTMHDAMRLKQHLHDGLTSGQKPDLHYVVVGAGPSGVELAAEMVSYLKAIRRRHRINKPFHVDLVEAAPRILPALPENFSRRIHQRLTKLGIKIYTSTAVKGETADTLQLPEGDIKTHTVVWTAGMTASPLVKQPNLFELGKGAKAVVDKNLRAGKNIWVSGDAAATERTGWAQTALYDGAYIARNIKRTLGKQPLSDYRPAAPIGAIPAGPGWCAVSFNGWQLYGRLGWFVRRWSDFKLYRSLLPFTLALGAWLSGHQIEETCPICRRGFNF